ncbi:patatin-like phospholipase family protein [Pontiellaceae bacterium B12227]|nr:patatin-like phospholipase family protein [Pontiellaceae bacterium B12227]
MHKWFIIILLSLATAAPLLHAEQERPKIGLVLGGGGALGFAHIGVLKVLEEQQIPIDYIGGTSMGAIVAGMYAAGMTPEEMEQSFLELDWWEVLRDRSPHQYLTYRRKEENKRFMGTEFGLNNRKLMFSPGMARGQKLNNVLETFTLNCAGISDFDSLNIPYRAIATDLRKGESVALKEGSLAKAMRASMAVPGAFTPVRMDGRVFVDGGIYNNIPVDVVKSMGADIIIAVDVGASGAAKGEQKDFLTLGEVIGRTYSIMQRPNQEKQLKNADLVIAPDLMDLSSSQFHKAADIIPRGRIAANELKKELSAYSADDSTYAAFLKKQRFKHDKQIIVDQVNVVGNDLVSEKTIRYRIKSEPGPLDLSTVNKDLLRMHGMGNFQTVTYDLHPNGENYDLLYLTQEKFWGPGFLHFGLKFDLASNASMLWSLLLNYTRTQMNDYGGELRIALQAGGLQRLIQTEWYQPISSSGVFFFSPTLRAEDSDIDLYHNDDVIAEVEHQEILGMLDLGISGFEFGEFRVGMIGGYVWDEGHSGIISLGEINEPLIGLTTRLRFDQLDDPVFPTKGARITLDGLFSTDELGSGQNFDRLEASALVPFSIGRHTVLPKISAGTSFGTDLPFYSTFHLGGQDSFAGYAPYQLFGNYYGLMSLGYRYRLGQLPPTLGNGLFALARFDAGNTWMDSDDVDITDLDYGTLLGLGADTVIGRCILSVGKAKELSHLRIYFSIGNNF